MGYKYGLWLVPTRPLKDSPHIIHFTIMCNMEREEAFQLYDILKALVIDPIQIKGTAVLFPNLYGKDDILEAWGYYATSRNWTTLKTICSDFRGSFSSSPHTSIDYSLDPNTFVLSNIKDIEMECTLHVANICSDIPSSWKLLN